MHDTLDSPQASSQFHGAHTPIEAYISSWNINTEHGMQMERRADGKEDGEGGSNIKRGNEDRVRGMGQKKKHEMIRWNFNGPCGKIYSNWDIKTNEDIKGM